MKTLFFKVFCFIAVTYLSGCAIKITETKASNHLKIDKYHSVVRWTDPNLTKAQKADLRKEFKILHDDDDVQTCSCGDTEYELWTWDYDNPEYSDVDIEGSKDRLVENGGGGGVEGDPNFEFWVPPYKKWPPLRIWPFVRDNFWKINGKKLAAIDALGLRQNLIYIPASTDSPLSVTDDDSDGIVDGNKIINIAIIDSGINYYVNQDLDPFLYDTSATFDCIDESCTGTCQNQQTSGWNFVEGDNDLQDYNGHGTYVTRQITSELMNSGIEYNILPVKIFDKNGKGSYWDVICAFNYVRSIQEAKGNLSIVNASFGYTYNKDKLITPFQWKVQDQPILREIIDELSDDVLVVTSSGNVGQNNDQFGNEHFVSQFDSNHILTIGGWYQPNDIKLNRGNYGASSVDVAAPFGYYNYEFRKKSNNGTPGKIIAEIKVAGTSYGTALTTTRIGQLIKQKMDEVGTNNFIMSPQQIKSDFLDVTNNWIKRDPVLSNYNATEGGFIDI